MALDFDPYDKHSWFWSELDRDGANCILAGEDSGVFLVRRSTSLKGDLVLCVREENDRINHYIINRLRTPKSDLFKFAGQDYPDVCSLLDHYRTHLVGTTGLLRPAQRERMLCKWDFAGRDPEDLPFKRGEVLELLTKDEPEWWTAKNKNGEVGEIPVKYIEMVGPSTEFPRHESSASTIEESDENEPLLPLSQVKLPAKAIVIQAKEPNVYDTTALRMKLNQIVTVHKMNPNGQWEGEIDGVSGKFPFTHVRFLTEDELADICSAGLIGKHSMTNRDYLP